MDRARVTKECRNCVGLAGQRGLKSCMPAPLRSIALSVVAALALAGCDVAGSAAAVGKLQADQAAQSRAMQARLVDGLNAAQRAGVERAASAAD
jgi:hypothetical protein